MNLIQKNIDNLTSLWRKVGEREHAHTSGDDFDFSAINYSEWPNRLWFHHDLNENSLKAAKNQLLSSSTKLIVPYWDIYQSQSYGLLEANGFEKLSEQVGMSLKLTQSYEKIEPLRLEIVTSKESAILWEELFLQAFNYRISHKLLLPGHEDIDYLIAPDYRFPRELASLAIDHYQLGELQLVNTLLKQIENRMNVRSREIFIC